MDCVRWVNCHHFDLYISRMRYICFRLCLLCSKLESVGHCLWVQQHHNAIHSFRNLEKTSCTAWHSQQNSHTNIWEFGGINLRTFIFILMKIKRSIHIMMLGVVSNYGDIMLPFVFPHGLRFTIAADIKFLKEVVLLWIESAVAERLRLTTGLCARVPRLESQKLSATVSLLTSGPLTSQITILWIIVCRSWARDQQNPAQHQRWTEGKDKDSIY